MISDDSKALLKWYDEEGSPYKNLAPAVLLSEDIAPLQFYLDTPTVQKTTKKFLFTNYTYIWLTIPLTRRLTGSFVNYYMPSSLLVFVSWITFWLQGEAAAERATLIMTSLLTICTQSNQYKSELPPMNYITAMDIWFFVCTFMIFATLIEFAFSHNIYRRGKMMKSLEEKETISFEYPDRSNDEGKQADKVKGKTGEKNEDKLNRNKKLLPKDETTRLDSLSKIVFPSFFLIFSLIYWVFYLCMCA